MTPYSNYLKDGKKTLYLIFSKLEKIAKYSHNTKIQYVHTFPGFWYTGKMCFLYIYTYKDINVLKSNFQIFKYAFLD